LCQSPPANQTVVAANELLIVNLIPFCQQHVTQMTRAFENSTSTAVRVALKCSCREIEAQRQFRTGDKLFNQEVSFGRSVPITVAPAPAGISTGRTANSAVVFRRPPKCAR